MGEPGRRVVEPPPAPLLRLAPDITGFRRLGRVLAALAAVTDVDGLVEAVVTEGSQAVGATVATLSVVDEDALDLVLLGSHGTAAGLPLRWGRHPLSDALPACDAVRSRQPIMLRGRAAIEAAYPGLLDAGGGEVTVMCLPLLAGERAVGAIGLQFPGLWSPEPIDEDFFAVFGATCAQALERVRAVEAARRNETRLWFLSRASAELAGSLDVRATLSRVAELAVPTLGDWCAVQIVEDGTLQTVAVAHRDPARLAMAEQLQARYPDDLDAPYGAGHVARTGVSELYPVITDEQLVAGARDAEHLRLARGLELSSLLIVPLTSRDRVLGVLTLMSSESGRRYHTDDVEFAEDLARRAAVALDNAQLHSQTLEVALRLQRAVLPGPLDGIPGWQVASLYRPAGRTEIGGDFYDAVPLPDGSLVAVVGDVMGRGVAAAAAMAQIRAAIRAYLASDPDPGSVVARLRTMFARYNVSQLVTVAIVRVDAAHAAVTVASAGHLPPVRVPGAGAAGGPVLLAAGANPPPLGPPLGPGWSVPASRTWAFPPGSVLLLYTDGLVERRDEDIDVGLARLLGQVRFPDDDLDRALGVLVDRVTDPRRDDDLTALALRATPTS